MQLNLTTVAAASLALAFLIAALIVADILAGRRQRMAIMNIVWPITALYGSALALLAYKALGRAEPREPAGGEPGPNAAVAEGGGGSRDGGAGMAMPRAAHRGGMPGMAHGSGPLPRRARPMWQRIAVATTHCGSGCVVGDVIGEAIMHFRPMTLFGREIFAGWALTYVLALFFGVIFQYFTIRPMRPDLGAAAALGEAFKADVLSLTAWQVGMYGWMAIATFAIFGEELSRGGPVFWFMMQVAMLAGYATSYPMNWILVRAGIKSAM
ncbi:MAG TPA: DUF4396 domain-containing protein [Phycisphaerales bacterium]|nr:DUF4396 domain-containing protein [Phycisphaerales bacterium]HMP36572.1 DUF4396 domain-containing protein [Phycisphaerales bacterium]